MTNAVTLRTLHDHQRSVQTRHGQRDSRIEPEGTGGGESSQRPREGQRRHSSPEQVGRDGKGHTDLSMREGEDLGGVGERHGTVTWRVEGPEQEDEEEIDVSRVRARDVETKSGSQEGPSHLGESEQEGSSSVGVDGSDGRPGKSSITRRLRINPGGFPDT